MSTTHSTPPTRTSPKDLSQRNGAPAKRGSLRRWTLLCASAISAGVGVAAVMHGNPETPVLPAQLPLAVAALPAAGALPVEAPDYSLFSGITTLSAFKSKPADPFAASFLASAVKTAEATAKLARDTLPADATATPTPAPTPAAKPADDASKLVAAGLDSDGKVQISVGKQSIIKTNVNITRVSLGTADVVEIAPHDTQSLVLFGKKTGTTQLIVWDDQGRSQTFDIVVSTDLASLNEQLKKSMPDANIDISEANGAVVLRGIVQNADLAKQAEELAGQYGKVLNHLEVAGGQRVVVKIQFAEVSRTVSDDLGVQWGFSDGRQVFGSNIGSLNPLGFALSPTNLIGGLGIGQPAAGTSVFGRGLSGTNEFAYFVKALQENNLMRLLSEPYVITTSGETGETFAGGQQAVPVPGSNGNAPTIEFRDFGIRLKCTPVVLGNGNIRMKVEYEVSQLDGTAGTEIQGTQVDGLRVRRGSNIVELAEGQTLPLSGLFDSQTVANVSKFPGLGDLPVIGQLFRSTKFQRRETELVVLVTPNLAGPFNPDQVPAVPGAGWRYPSVAEMSFNGDAGGDAQADEIRDRGRAPSKRGANPKDGTDKNGKVIATADGPRGYASTSPLSNPKPVHMRADQLPPLFMGSAGYAPIDGTATDTATVGEH